MTDSEIRVGVLKFFRETDTWDVSPGDLPGYGLPNFEKAIMQLQTKGVIHCFFNDDEMTDERNVILIRLTPFGLDTIKRNQG